jgi:hypothetical protein
MAFLPDNRRDDEFRKIFRRIPFDHIFAGVLKSRGANVNLKDRKGYSPLLFSSRLGDVKALSWLKTHRANLEEVDPLGSSALHIAAINGRLEAVEWLLRHTKLGANPRNTIGATPLHWCVDAKVFNKPMLDLLINAGADPNAITVGGWRPIDFANNRRNSGWKGEYDTIVRWLEEQGAGDVSLIAMREKKKSLKHRDWNIGSPRELIPCADGNDGNRQKVSADIFSERNVFGNNQEEDQRLQSS